MQQDFYKKKALKPEIYQAKIDISYEKVNHEFNQDIEIKQSLPEIRCEVHPDSTTETYIYL